jgi:hypothetical protein
MSVPLVSYITKILHCSQVLSAGTHVLGSLSKSALETLNVSTLSH